MASIDIRNLENTKKSDIYLILMNNYAVRVVKKRNGKITSSSAVLDSRGIVYDDARSSVPQVENIFRAAHNIQRPVSDST